MSHHHWHGGFRPCARFISWVDHFHRLNALEGGFSLCHTCDWRHRLAASLEHRREEDSQNHKPGMMTVSSAGGPTARRPIQGASRESHLAAPEESDPGSLVHTAWSLSVASRTFNFERKECLPKRPAGVREASERVPACRAARDRLRQMNRQRRDGFADRRRTTGKNRHHASDWTAPRTSGDRACPRRDRA